MALTVIALLILAGLIFILLEVLVVPGTTFVGIIGFLIMVVAVYYAFYSHGAVVGSIALAATLLVSFGGVALALRSNTWKKATLNTFLDGKVNTFGDSAVKVGDVGKAISRLSPMGKIRINDQFYEAQSRGGYVDEGSEVKVIKVEGNKIYVNLND